MLPSPSSGKRLFNAGGNQMSKKIDEQDHNEGVLAYDPETGEETIRFYDRPFPTPSVRDRDADDAGDSANQVVIAVDPETGEETAIVYDRPLPTPLISSGSSAPEEGSDG